MSKIPVERHHVLSYDDWMLFSIWEYIDKDCICERCLKMKNVLPTLENQILSEMVRKDE